LIEPTSATPSNTASSAGGRRIGVAWRVLALGWLACVLAVGLHQWEFWRTFRVNTDVMALLPVSERSATADRALRQLADGVSREVVVLVGAPDWARAQAAAVRFQGITNKRKALLEPVDRMAGFDLGAALSMYRPYRQGLLTDAQRAALQQADPHTLAGQSLARLYQFSTGPRLTAWRDDPLGLWPDWWKARAAATRVSERDGLATVSGEGRQWVVLSFRTMGPAFSTSGATDYADLLRDASRAAMHDDDTVHVITAGIPLHAESAAAQANTEMNVIGWGSLAAVIALVWLAFRSLRPIALVAASLLVGTAIAISVTAIVFDSVHLVTLVFGASLVGVAEDFGIHYFAIRQARPGSPSIRTMRLLLPSMSLALGTSVAAYLALGIAPFPALRQMALFSAVGLVGTFLTVVLWFPWLDRKPLRATRFSGWLANSLAHWPRIGANWRSVVAALALAAFIVPGLMRLHVSDDLRQLQSSPPSLAEAQRTAGRLLGTPGPAQFVLVRGASPDEVMVREEAVKAALDGLVRDHTLDGVIAISDWVPSAARQRTDAALVDTVEDAVRKDVARRLGSGEFSADPPAEAADVLTLAAWLAHPVSASLRQLWLGTEGNGYASVMLLRGLDEMSEIPRTAAAVAGVPGAQWVDRVADFSSLLQRYRTLMSWLLGAGAIAIALLLYAYHGLPAWRALVPTLLAATISLALMGWLHMPLQLFSVLALALLLGVGVDYGIFLLEHPGDGTAWTAIVLGAASTLLAFGLLALSSTPALRAFGTTMLSGVGNVWLLSPCFRPHNAVDAPRAH